MDTSKGRGKQKMDQISEGVANISVESADDGPREVSMKKSNRGGNRPSTLQSIAPNRGRGQPAMRGAGRGNVRPQPASYTRAAFPVSPVASPPPRPAVAAPLGRGWNWKSNRGGNTPSTQQNIAPNRGRGQPAMRGAGRGNVRPQPVSYNRAAFPVSPVAPPPPRPVVAAPLGSGWNWKSNRGGNRPSTQQNIAPNRGRGQPAMRGAGRGNVIPQPSNYSRPAFPVNPVAPPPPRPVVVAPLERGWNWTGPGASTTSSVMSYPVEDDDDVENDNDSEVDDDDDDDEPFSDDSGFDASDLSFEARKKKKWFRAFFSTLDKLSVEEINTAERRWHCPACQGGPGAIAWYEGLQALLTHAKTKSKKVKLHRELAELLDEEIRQRGASIVPPGEAFAKWEGLKNIPRDREIVWPPMVVIMNTKFEQDDKDKWIGMGNPELLLDYFSSYGADKASHSYGPQGHRGMSVLIFEGSAIGYIKAKRLHKHFKQQHTDRNAWDHHGVRFSAGGIRQLYGFMAEKHDLEFFNQHAQGKSARSRLKYELRSYEEMVLSQLHKMHEDNQELTYYQDKMAKAEMRAKAIEESYEFVSEELRKKDEEIRILRERSRSLNQQSKEEMDYQESVFKNQLCNIHDARDSKENSFERLQQEERRKVEQSNARREAEYFVLAKAKGIERFEDEKDWLMEAYEKKREGMKKRHLLKYYEEEVELEKQLDAQLDQLMKKYTTKF